MRTVLSLKMNMDEEVARRFLEHCKQDEMSTSNIINLCVEIEDTDDCDSKIMMTANDGAIELEYDHLIDDFKFVDWFNDEIFYKIDKEIEELMDEENSNKWGSKETMGQSVPLRDTVIQTKFGSVKCSKMSAYWQYT